MYNTSQNCPQNARRNPSVDPEHDNNSLFGDESGALAGGGVVVVQHFFKEHHSLETRLQ